jgi:hypothetical protein
MPPASVISQAYREKTLGLSVVICGYSFGSESLFVVIYLWLSVVICGFLWLIICGYLW